MSNITPSQPSFVFGYWRPWKEDSNFIDSYLDYAKDISLAKYGADTVGTYISIASKSQVQAINHLGQALGRGMNVLSNQISDVKQQMSESNQTLRFMNRNLDILIEQQKLSNLLLQSITELLRVPDNEKERQHSIELGLKFFVNAKNDPDLYADSLEELLKAESLMKQDYFVLHRIGLIYLYVEKYINPSKALEYFQKAAKYASVETSPSALLLANALTKNFNVVNSEVNNSKVKINYLAADSYEKAAFSAYVLGRFEEAVIYQSKAFRLNLTSENRFVLSKYQVRNNNINDAIVNLDMAIDETPLFALAVFNEIDLINEPEVIKIIAKKNEDADNKITGLIEKWKTLNSTEANEVLNDLRESLKKSYDVKISNYTKYDKKKQSIEKSIMELSGEIDAYITEVRKTSYCTWTSEVMEVDISELLNSKNIPLEKSQKIFDSFKKNAEKDRLTIGANYAGGIVFYLDKTGQHGLVCSDRDFGDVPWCFKGSYDSNKQIGAFGDGIANMQGMNNTKRIVDAASWEIERGILWSTKRPARTAARLCLESNYNGFVDWYLPTSKELELLSKLDLKGGLKNDIYWSSTEVNSWQANHILHSRYSPNCSSGRKECTFNVRAVRAF